MTVMNCFCSTALDGVIQGVTSASALLLIGFGYTCAKDIIVRRRLRKALSYIGTERSCHGFGVSISNSTTFDIIVKDVTLFDTNNLGMRLLFAHQELSFTASEKPFKDPRKYVFYGAELPDAGQPAWQLVAISLGSNTKGVWLAPSILFEKHPEFRPVRCQFAVQYQNLLGKPQILVVDAKPPNNTDVAIAFDEYLKEKNS
jgi:hypothetical protein